MARTPLPAFDLKAARKAKNLSQVKVAEILCTSQPSVARWEAAGNLPAIYRKAWNSHWQLETLGDKPNDARPNKRAGKSGKSSGPTRRSTKRARRSVERLSEGEAGSESESSIDSAE